ncbi:MAG TPA: TRAFs-binding domain-containing protein, partial [Allosphingosinicella sp.]
MRDHSLSRIIALARAGSTSRAWREFVAAGHDADTGDAAALAVKGRLLKDRALAAAGADRNAFYAAAADAYRQAAALTRSSYHGINAATLSLLGGEPDAAQLVAGEVLELLRDQPEEGETPYWRVATRAEALLLLGRDYEASTSFVEAIALAPEAWEDHASTLRQFALILDAQGKDSAWLDAHRPPRSLHFGGHMSFDAGVSRREHLDRKIAALLEEEKVGFGYGALAAGADIIVAEALVARGAELHAVLPGGAEAFAAVSVDPFGAVWRRRFDALLDRAATVRAVRPLGAPPDPETIALADEIAMGAAAMNARRLESQALQLLVADADAGERE